MTEFWAWSDGYSILGASWGTMVRSLVIWVGNLEMGFLPVKENYKKREIGTHEERKCWTPKGVWCNPTHDARHDGYRTKNREEAKERFTEGVHDGNSVRGLDFLNRFLSFGEIKKIHTGKNIFHARKNDRTLECLSPAEVQNHRKVATAKIRKSINRKSVWMFPNLFKLSTPFLVEVAINLM